MTDVPVSHEAREVTRADREAADQFLKNADLITLDRYEQGIAEAFARHRQQAERDVIARMEPVGWLYKKQGEEPQITTTRWRDIMDGKFVFGCGDWTETPLYALPTPPAGEA